MAALLVGAGWACGDTLVSVILVDRVEIEPAADSVFLEQTRQLEATSKDARGNTLLDRPVEWSSQAAGIATVDDAGLVRGLTRGVATITATVEGVRGTAEITVLRWPELQAEPDSVPLDIVIGEAGDSAVAKVAIRNLGDGEFEDLTAVVQHVGEVPAWLRAALSGDTAVVLTARGAGLERGDYRANVTLSAGNAINTPVEFPVTLDVFRNNPAPSLTAVAPDTVQRETTVDVVLMGDGFADGLTTVGFGPQVAVNAVTVSAPDRLTANITVERLATLGPRDVSVSNPEPGGGTAVLEDGLVVEGQHPFPTLQALTPDSAHREATLDVTIDGSGFVEGLTTVDFGPQIALSGVTVTSDSQLVASITVGADAAAGPRDVRVANPAPGGGIATRPDAFRVLGTNPQPGLTAVAPDSAQRGRTLDLQLTGSGFSAGYTTVDVGAGIAINATTVTSTTSLSANVTVQPDAPLGPRPVHVINAAPGGGTATLDDALTVLLGDVSATASSVTVEPDTVVADGADSALVTVMVADDNGDAIGGLADAFEIDAGSSVAVSSVVETSTQGTYMFNLRSTLAQTAALVVAVNGVTLAASPTVELVAGEATGINSTLSVSSSVVRADGMAPAGVTVTLEDQFNNRVSGLASAFDIVVTGSAIAGSVTDQGNGVYTFDVTNTVAEDVTVTVTILQTTGDVTLGAASITFIPGVVDTDSSSVVANPTTGITANGTAFSTVTVTVKDGNGNLIDDLTGGDFSVTANSAPTSVVVTPSATLNDGVYSFQFTSTVADTFDIAVTAATVALADTVSIEFVAGAVSASVSSVTADPTSGLTADGVSASLVTVLLRDAQNNPIGNATLTIGLTTGASHGTISEPTEGTYQFSVTSTAAVPVTVTVTANLTELDDKPIITFGADAVDAANSTAVADPLSITAGTNSTVTVTLRDGNDNLISGESSFTIAFTGTASGGASNGAVAETVPGTGVYEFTVSSTAAGTLNVQITAGGVKITQEPSIEVTAAAVSAANSTVVTPSSGVVVDPAVGGAVAGGSNDND